MLPSANSAGSGLHRALEEGRGKHAHFLLRTGTAVNTRDDQGRTALMKVALLSSPKQARAVCGLLIDSGALSRVSDNQGWTALHHAVEHDRPSLVDQLLRESGVELQLRDKKGYTALHLSVLLGHTQCVRKILDYTNDSFLSPDLPDPKGMTPLHHACAKGDLEIMWLFVQHGKANMYQRDNVNFFNAFDWWNEGRKQEMANSAKYSTKYKRPRSAMAKLQTPRDSLMNFLHNATKANKKKDRNVFALTNIYGSTSAARRDDEQSAKADDKEDEQDLPKLFEQMKTFAPSPPTDAHRSSRYVQRRQHRAKSIAGAASGIDDSGYNSDPDAKSKDRAQPSRLAEAFGVKKELTASGNYVKITSTKHGHNFQRINFRPAPPSGSTRSASACASLPPSPRREAASVKQPDKLPTSTSEQRPGSTAEFRRRTENQQTNRPTSVRAKSVSFIDARNVCSESPNEADESKSNQDGSQGRSLDTNPGGCSWGSPTLFDLFSAYSDYRSPTYRQSAVPQIKKKKKRKKRR